MQHAYPIILHSLDIDVERISAPGGRGGSGKERNRRFGSFDESERSFVREFSA